MNFQHIPDALRVPLFYAEVDNSHASVFSVNQPTLLIGQMFETGTATLHSPILINRADEAATAFGRGSLLHQMVQAYRSRDSFGEVWCLPVADAKAGIKATGTITFSGTIEATGTVQRLIGGQVVRISVIREDTAATIAQAFAEAVNANTDVPVTASAEDQTVTLTAYHAGEIGNDIDIRCVPIAGGKASDPSGITVSVATMAGGQNNPDLSNAIAGIGDETYDFIVCPYSDRANLDALKTFMDDATGRWSWARQVYGHVFSIRRGTVAQLDTFGATLNSQHMTVFGLEPVAALPWEVISRITAEAAKSLRNDPGRPLQSLPLDVAAADPEKRFTLQERQVLLTSGVATLYAAAGALHIERAITTYQVNAYQQPDTSYLDVNTLYSIAHILRFLKQRITSKYGRHKLADDGTRFGSGQAIVTPKIIRAELIAAYGELERDGLVENAQAFKENLIVTRNAHNPNRLDVLLPPDLVNQLRVFAVLTQFRLQY